MLLVSCLLLAVSSAAQTLSWRGNYDRAHQEALKQDKPLLVLVVKAHHTPSRIVLRDVLMNQPYIPSLNESVVAVMVTYEKETSYPVEMYYTTTFPTLFLVDAKTELFLDIPLYGEEITPAHLSRLLEVLSHKK
jgi:thioredoxin-related protein